MGATEQIYQDAEHAYTRALIAAAPRLRTALAGRTAADLAADTLAAKESR